MCVVSLPPSVIDRLLDALVPGKFWSLFGVSGFVIVEWVLSDDKG
jgi:hypothetical protein